MKFSALFFFFFLRKMPQNKQKMCSYVVDKTCRTSVLIPTGECACMCTDVKILTYDKFLWAVLALKSQTTWSVCVCVCVLLFTCVDNPTGIPSDEVRVSYKCFIAYLYTFLCWSLLCVVPGSVKEESLCCGLCGCLCVTVCMSVHPLAGRERP